jgi:hypothetical protein
VAGRRRPRRSRPFPSRPSFPHLLMLPLARKLQPRPVLQVFQIMRLRPAGIADRHGVGRSTRGGEGAAASLPCGQRIRPPARMV